MFDFNIHHIARNACGLRVYFYGKRQGKRTENWMRPVWVVVQNGYWQPYKKPYKNMLR